MIGKTKIWINAWWKDFIDHNCCFRQHRYCTDYCVQLYNWQCYLNILSWGSDYKTLDVLQNTKDYFVAPLCSYCHGLVPLFLTYPPPMKKCNTQTHNQWNLHRLPFYQPMSFLNHWNRCLLQHCVLSEGLIQMPRWHEGRHQVAAQSVASGSTFFMFLSCLLICRKGKDIFLLFTDLLHCHIRLTKT